VDTLSINLKLNFQHNLYKIHDYKLLTAQDH